MTRTTRNRLLAILLALIPVGSYYYFLTDFMSDKPDTTKNTVSGGHRYRIVQEKPVDLQNKRTESLQN